MLVRYGNDLQFSVLLTKDNCSSNYIGNLECLRGNLQNIKLIIRMHMTE